MCYFNVEFGVVVDGEERFRTDGFDPEGLVVVAESDVDVPGVVYAHPDEENPGLRSNKRLPGTLNRSMTPSGRRPFATDSEAKRHRNYQTTKRSTSSTPSRNTTVTRVAVRLKLFATRSTSTVR